MCSTPERMAASMAYFCTYEANSAKYFVVFRTVVNYLGAVLMFDTRVRDEVEATRPIESIVKSF